MNRESTPSNALCGSHAEVAMIFLITKLKKIDLDHLNFAKRPTGNTGLEDNLRLGICVLLFVSCRK